MANISLLGSTSRVETPFIIATIGNYTFGLYSKNTQKIIDSTGVYKKVITTYPNYMKSLVINKVNGAINSYTLTMVYPITEGSDPNLLEKVFSSVSSNRNIKLSYGDYSIPNYIYKEEEAIINNITSDVNIRSSTITYTLTCVSKALNLNAGTFSFPKRNAKPSDVIKEILYDTRYGLLDIFYGMRDKELILSRGLIASDDKSVIIEAKRKISILDYLSYLVGCMSNISDESNALIKNFKYVFSVVDEISGDFSGPYFKVTKVAKNFNSDIDLNTYQIDVGYPSKDIIMDFTINDNQTYSILYDYSKAIQQTNYIYRINNSGDIVSQYSPTIATSNNLMKTTQVDKTWWTRMTQYPITTNITIKGLLRPAILMTYVKLNVLFYGRQHISSGYYIVTQQTDTIDSSGYRTNLKLTRIASTNKE